jgi:S1-C subfamily serine protease
MKRIAVEGDAFLVPEAGCMVAMESEALTVLDVMPPGMRPKEYADLDFRQGDKILMVNGVKLKSVSDLRTLYEKAGVGSELKFGVGRQLEKHLVAFKKADPATLPKTKMVTFDTGPGEGEMIPGLGVVAMESAKVVVKVPLPEAEERLKEKDIIVSVNGKKISSAKKLAEICKAIPVGSEMELGIVRTGTAKVVKMKKTEPQGQVIIRK